MTINIHNIQRIRPPHAQNTRAYSQSVKERQKRVTEQLKKETGK